MTLITALMTECDNPLEDLQLLAGEVGKLDLKGVVMMQYSMAQVRSHYESLIESADMTDMDTVEAVGLFQQAITLIDQVRTRLNHRKGELVYAKRD